LPRLLHSDYTNDRNFEELTPRASVSCLFSDQLAAYAAYSDGFKTGGFATRGDLPHRLHGRVPEHARVERQPGVELHARAARPRAASTRFAAGDHVLRDSLPRNPNGKILKRELRAEYVRA